MENFVVSARKYRPSNFDSVIGQEHITQTLKNAIRSNHLAHAFLFCGPRGVGKTTCARILAKTINCQNLTPEIEACNECDSCKAFNSNVSFNIYELDAASNNSVDDIRGLVEQVRYAPQGARYKIYIIDEVHMLSSAAFNAFLKTLEEPPPYAKFILATTERHKILPTILSRCQVFDFHRIKIEHAVNQLNNICSKEGITAEEEALHIIAQKADGAMRDALSIFDRIVSFAGKNITYKDVIQNLNILDYEYYFKAVDLMLEKNVPDLFLLFDDIINNGFDVQHFLIGLNEHLRNLSVCKYPNTVTLLEVAPAVQKRFLEQSAKCSLSFLLNGLNMVNTCEQELRSSKNQRLLVELYLMKLAHIQSVIDLNAAAADAKKKTPDVETASNFTLEKPAIEKTKEPEQPVAEQKSTPAAPPPFAPPPLFGNGARKDALSKIRQNLSSGAQQPPENKPAAPVSENEEPAPMVDTTAVLTNELVRNWLEQYISQLEQNGSRVLLVIYKDAKLNVLNAETVEMRVGSSHEAELIEEDRNNLMPFLRKNLKMPSMDIQLKIDNTAVVHKVFTSEDKFKAMTEKNPLLNDFRNLLHLELE
jgi:DNA polymerase-3 subunit gamma/tau